MREEEEESCRHIPQSFCDVLNWEVCVGGTGLVQPCRNIGASFSQMQELQR